MTVDAARDRRLVQPALVALARTVAGRMAVHTARSCRDCHENLKPHV
jgi:hypothetical protein